MGLRNIYNRIALLSPRIEVMLRKLYWKNVKHLKQFRPSEHNTSSGKITIFDFNEIVSWLEGQGVREGSLIIVHSSYDALSGCGLKPNEVIQQLRNLIGVDGTIAMPVIRKYKEYPNPENLLSADFSQIECTYDPKRTPVSSGLLPSILMREKDARISLHPLNTLAAAGPKAEMMMLHNLDGERPSPHGPNSSWKFCLDNNAIIVSLGVNMVHHLTIAHIAEDCFKDWPYHDWYNDIKFNIVLPDKTVISKIVRERKPKWGLFYDAELNFEKDLKKSGIMHTKMISGVPVGVMQSTELLDFIRKQNNKTYPYYII